MDSVYFEPVLDRRNQWLTHQIRQLSVDVLSLGTYTCTACGEVAGEYILDYAGQKLRLSTAETYALLKFVLEAGES